MTYLLIDLVRIASTVFTLLVIGRALLSWVSPDPRNPIVRFVYQLTEPVLAPVRNVLPSAGGIDFSPLLVIIAVQVLESVLVRLLLGMA